MHPDAWSAIFGAYNWLNVSDFYFAPLADHAIQKQVGHNQVFFGVFFAVFDNKKKQLHCCNCLIFSGATRD